MSPQDEKYILAIDLGTSGSKTALVSMYGEVIDFAFQEVPLYLLPRGGAEQNPDEWWHAIMATSKRLLSKGLVSPEDIAAIACSTQWVGTVAVDPEGCPLMNAVIWMDSRGAPYVRQLVDGFIKIAGYDVFKLQRWIRLTGGAPALTGKDPVGHILLIKNEYPAVYQKTSKFLEPKDYINLRLTGRTAASFDSITCHWVTDNRDISRIAYHDKLLKLSTIERDKLPELKRSIDILGPVKPEIARDLGLKSDVPVVMGSPDVQAAALGSGAVRDHAGHLYIGTSSWIAAHVPFKKTDVLHGMASIPSAIPDRYLLVSEQETAGGTLTFLKDNILYHPDQLRQADARPDIYQVFDQIAANVPPGSHKVIFTPWLNGERAPAEDNAVRACLYNLSLSSSRADIIRAFLEGVAFNQRWALKYVEKFMGRPLNPIHMVGGGAASDIWCQIHADILNRTIKQVQDPIQANARGAAFIAAVALGRLNFSAIPQHVQIRKVYEPHPEHRKLYDEMFHAFLNIYKKNKRIYARLNADA
ncbi:MAG: FGGY-family carbohydrate kinase [Desulfobacterales bacterium]|nr:MAG: FGGY-family carbohydrate kinase [Desulfobacterales bacterium]